ncbi:MAG TPA: 50S ribosomal protein L29 [Thermomicrobiales bacterium]|nr:50S ribosomal protein L29 [Thermomicrobiales bacterium]
MNIEEVRALSDEEIGAEIDKQHEAWRNLRFQDALGRLTAFHQFGEVRRSIARLKTVQKEREIARDPVAYYGANDRVRARRRAEKQVERLARRRHERRNRNPKRRMRR